MTVNHVFLPRLAALAVGIIIMFVPSLAHAQTGVTVPPGRREGFAIGVVATLAAGQGGPFDVGVISLRLSMPAGRKAGFDFDFGRVVGNGRWGAGWRPKGFAGGAHVRWLPKGRSVAGWSGYLIAGPRFVQTERTGSGDEPTRSVSKGFDFPGFGVDRVLSHGHRTGFELGMANLIEAPMPFLNGFASWAPER